jgi:hypothetical protein
MKSCTLLMPTTKPLNRGFRYLKHLYMNTYSKLIPNVYVAKCTEQHERGSIIPVTTKYGKNNNCIVFNLIYQKDGYYFYSIVREDGHNCQQYALNRANKRLKWAISADNKSNEYYVRSNTDRACLSLGEPIKIGHHSEHRHRKIIAEQWANMGKSVEFANKAEDHRDKAEYWESKANVINLSMPESIGFFTYKLELAKAHHAGLKARTIEKGHSFSLTYAKKEVNELQKKLDWAIRLWQ